ncbi:MAG: phosphoenolpyruvate carboxylase [Gammaproteobacteria bacterium]
MSNPVAQLGFELSRKLEAGTLCLDELDESTRALAGEAFLERASRLHELLTPTESTENEVRFAALATATAKGGYDVFTDRWARPLLGCVFTAHPTFLLSPSDYCTLAQQAANPTAAGDLPLLDNPSAPSIEEEHSAALSAINCAADAQARLAGLLVSVAEKHFPDQWRSFRPAPFEFATWVGYDMDGRTDIAWTTSIRFRLHEKQNQIERYLSLLRPLADQEAAISSVLESLAAGHRHNKDMLQAFSDQLDTPAALSQAANALTADDPSRLVSLQPLIERLDEISDTAHEELVARLIPVISAMRSQGLGCGTVHFRINASQLHNAIRRHLGADADLDIESRSGLTGLRDLIDRTESVPVNFANLAIETTTAVRQFLAIAQIVKHIDADSPVRLLIAECEQPTTVLTALFFARLFGIEDRIDISPLFETETALEHGGRFIDALLGEEIYRRYARNRGRVAIQTGFSDAGRFLGQIPASLAIERLQGRLAQQMSRHGLSNVSALIFNTHGESMGRGAHPASIGERLKYAMSHWTRAQFAGLGIRLEHEVSFQGGDGYVYFGSSELALALLTRVAEVQIDEVQKGENDDPFYTEVDVSLDFYRDVRDTQARYFRDKSYNRALMSFGLSLLSETGSRQSRRQSDIAMERSQTLRSIRAIPQNAVLQQLGYPVNVIAGIGEATASDQERFAGLIERSERAQSLIRLVASSNQLASIKTLGSYGELYNGAFWATRPYQGAEPQVERACLELAERLAVDDRAAAYRQLATLLRVDGLKLRRLLDLLPAQMLPAPNEARRRTLGILHALRLALIQHIFLRAAQIPPFSRRNDIGRDEILEMVFALRIPDAVALLRNAYPVEAPDIQDFNLTEPGALAGGQAPDYASIHTEYIDAIERAYAMSLRISTAIALHFGAHG